MFFDSKLCQFLVGLNKFLKFASSLCKEHQTQCFSVAGRFWVAFSTNFSTLLLKTGRAQPNGVALTGQPRRC
jgi:hypothetical protein